MKNKFLLATLCLLAINFSCQKEEEIPIEESNLQSEFRIELINKSEIKKNNQINTVLQAVQSKLDSKDNTKNSQARDLYFAEYNFYLHDEQAYHVTFEGYESFTFAITRAQDNGLIENLMFSKLVEETYQVSILSYDLTETEKQSLANGILPLGIENKTSITPLGIESAVPIESAQRASISDPDIIAIGSTGIYYDPSTGGCIVPEFDLSGDTITYTWVSVNCPQNAVDYIGDGADPNGASGGGTTSTNDDNDDDNTTNTSGGDNPSNYDDPFGEWGGSGGDNPSNSGNDGVTNEENTNDPCSENGVSTSFNDGNGNCIDGAGVPLLPPRDEDNIIFDASIIGTCVEDILYDFILSDFPNSLDAESLIEKTLDALTNNLANVSVTYKIENISANGSTTAPVLNTRTNKYDITVKIDTDLIQNGTKLAIAKTILHESIHAYLRYLAKLDPISFNDPNGDFSDLIVAYQVHRNLGFAHHVYMAMIISQIGQQLKQYSVETLGYPNMSSEYITNEIFEYYEAVAWSGIAFIRDPNSPLQQIINPVFSTNFPNILDRNLIIDIFTAENTGQPSNGVSPEKENGCD